MTLHNCYYSYYSTSYVPILFTCKFAVIAHQYHRKNFRRTHRWSITSKSKDKNSYFIYCITLGDIQSYEDTMNFLPILSHYSFQRRQGLQIPVPLWSQPHYLKTWVARVPQSLEVNTDLFEAAFLTRRCTCKDYTGDNTCSNIVKIDSENSN